MFFYSVQAKHRQQQTLLSCFSDLLKEHCQLLHNCSIVPTYEFRRLTENVLRNTASGGRASTWPAVFPMCVYFCRPSSGGRPWCCAACWTLTPAVPPDFLSQAIITNHDVMARKFSPRQTGGRQNAINTTVEAFGVVSQMSRVETSRWRRTAEIHPALWHVHPCASIVLSSRRVKLVHMAQDFRLSVKTEKQLGSCLD